MKFMRLGHRGSEIPAALGRDNTARDLSRLVDDISPASLPLLNALSIEDIERQAPVSSDLRIGACISGVPNLVAIGLNYRKHAEETNNEIPTEPLVFSKHTSCITGPNDEVQIPPGAQRTDWEVELGVVIGRAAYQVAEASALDHVFGYCTVNDISERDLQLKRGGQWIKGKSNPGFAPIGPWLVTADEIPDPQRLRLQLRKNGVIQQDSTTEDMIFTVAEIVSYLSRFMRLVPGDVIITGTPSGIGSRQTPPHFLLAGDWVEAEVSGLGRQRTWFA